MDFCFVFSEIVWVQAEVQELLEQVEKQLPEKDNFKYSTTAEKLDWGAVAFKSFSGRQCKKKWMEVCTKVTAIPCYVFSFNMMI